MFRGAFSQISRQATNGSLFRVEMPWARGFSTGELAKRGRVKWFDTTKGFGFLIPVDKNTDVELDNERDVFVHFTSIQQDNGEFRQLVEHEIVEYELDEHSQSPKAVSVKRINPPPNRPRGMDY